LGGFMLNWLKIMQTQNIGVQSLTTISNNQEDLLSSELMGHHGFCQFTLHYHQILATFNPRLVIRYRC